VRGRFLSTTVLKGKLSGPRACGGSTQFRAVFTGTAPS
jgi:hypothetical protein